MPPAPACEPTYCKTLKFLGIKAEFLKEVNIDSYEAVVFQKAYSAKDIALAKQLRSKDKSIIFDLCDNHYALGTNEKGYQEKIDRLNEMMRLADCVTVPTIEASNFVSHRCIKIVPDAIDKYPKSNYSFIPRTRFRQQVDSLLETKGTINLVWFGNGGMEKPPWGMIELCRLKHILHELYSEFPLKLNIISNNKYSYEKYFSDATFPCRYYPWNIKTFPYLMRCADIALIPVTINDFTRGKSSNRVITALDLGLPVIADPLPSYEEFSNFIRIGNWRENILEYAKAPDLRRDDVEKGQAYIRSNYNNKQIAKVWLDIFHSLGINLQ